MTNTEYQDIKTRVVNGKKFLEGKWHMEKDLVDLWLELSEMLFQEEKKRGTFDAKKEDLPKSRVPGETPDEYIARMRKQLGFEKKKAQSFLKKDQLERLFT